jgi:hypothetical protein
LPRGIDLPVLPLARGIPALVIAAQQENDPLPVRVTENPEEHFRALSGSTRPGFAADDVLVVSYTELEEALPEMLPMLGTANVEPEICKVMLDRGDGRCALRAVKGLQPFPGGLASLIIFEKLDLPTQGLLSLTRF